MKDEVCTGLPPSEPFICLFSGGKDCVLALSMATRQGRAVALLNSVKDINELNNHNQSMDFTRHQAKSIGLPLDICIGDPQSPGLLYRIVKRLKQYNRDVRYLVTGILQNKRDYDLNREIAELAGMTLCCPLWGMDYEDILAEMESRRIKAIITSIMHPDVPREWLGKVYDRESFNAFKNLKVDPLGEYGEFHTTVVDCDIFSYELSIGK